MQPEQPLHPLLLEQAEPQTNAHAPEQVPFPHPPQAYAHPPQEPQALKQAAVQPSLHPEQPPLHPEQLPEQL